MLFGKKVTIVEVKASEIKAYKLSVRGSRLKEVKTITYAYDGGKYSLEGVFKKIKQQLRPGKIRLLFPEEKFYLLLLEQDTLGEEELTSKILQLIPENVDDLYYDWKLVSEDKKPPFKVQFYGAPKAYVNKYLEAAYQAGIDVEFFESLSFSLSRLTISDDQSHAIIYKYDKEDVLFLCALHGNVFMAITDKVNADLKQTFKVVSAYARKNFSINIHSVYIDPGHAKELETQLKGVGLDKVPLDPVAGVATRIGLTGKDRNLLLIKFPSKKDYDTAAKKKSGNETVGSILAAPKMPVAGAKKAKVANPDAGKKRNQVLILVVLFVMLIGVVANSASKMLNDSKKPVAPAAGVVKEAEPDKVVEEEAPVDTNDVSKEVSTEEPAPTDVPATQYSIGIQNGNGIPGEATNVKNLLESGGFTVEATSNADRYDYTDTIIMSSITDAPYLNKLKSTLELEYSSVVIEDNSEINLDIVVILGTHKGT